MTFKDGFTEGRKYAATHRSLRIRARRYDFMTWLTSANGDHRYDDYAKGYLAGLG